MEVEVEDDVFFADLSKQIALLIMDEEEEFELGLGLRLPVQCPQLHLQQELILPPPLVQVRVPPPPPYGLAEVPFPRKSIASKGTGVFIPRSSNAPARRKTRSRRSAVNPSADANSTRRREPLHISNDDKMP